MVNFDVSSDLTQKTILVLFVVDSVKKQFVLFLA